MCLPCENGPTIKISLYSDYSCTMCEMNKRLFCPQLELTENLYTRGGHLRAVTARQLVASILFVVPQIFDYCVALPSSSLII